ncbi:MAG: Do family serine endopeptidase [Marinilabilia sp.]
MKRFTSLIIAAFIGGTLTIGGFFLLGFQEKQPVKIEHVSATPVKGVSYSNDEGEEMAPLNFTDVAKEVMPGVVHIKSTNMRNARQRGQQPQNPRDIPEPFRRFFEDDMFEHFFGPFGDPRQQQPRQPQPQVGAGSGVIINEEGYIVTNNHVVANADDIEVTLHDNRVMKAKVVGTDPSTDIALLQIRANDLEPLAFANSDEVQVGEWVLAVGNPFNLNSTVTAGIISAKGRNINILNDQNAIESFIQTDAAINPGNSGGALVNMSGGLVGINTAIASPTGAYAGYGFAVPANIVSKVVSDLLKYGAVQRGYLGLLIRDVNGNFARENDLEVTSGVYVDSISENSAAGDADVKEGDVITEVNGKTVKSTGELLETIGRHHPGDEVTLTIDRKGEKMEFDVVLRNQEGEARPLEKKEQDVLSRLGIEVEELEKSEARKLGIGGGVQITELKNGKLKQETDIREGFIITSMNGKAVRSVDDFVSRLKKAEGGVFLEGVYEQYPGKYYYAFGM